MFNWFLITSAINISYNNSDVEKRLLETMETIDSIKTHCPGSKIVLLEGSPKELDKPYRNEILKKCSLYVSSYQDEMIQRLHNSAKGNMQLVKTPSELHLLMGFLNKQNFIAPIDRVFKISGRYRLNNKFNYFDHAIKDNLVIKQKEPAVTYFDRETGQSLPKLTDYQYKTRLYSFCGSMVPYMADKYNKMFVSSFKLYSSGQFTDIEHLMYYHLKENSVRQIPVLGLSGNSAENGELIEE